MCGENIALPLEDPLSSCDFTLAVLRFTGPKDTKTDVNSSHLPMWLCILTIAYTLLFCNYRRKLYPYLGLQSDVFPYFWLP